MVGGHERRKEDWKEGKKGGRERGWDGGAGVIQEVLDVCVGVCTE